MDTLFFIASKLVWALLQPGTWIVLSFGAVYLATRLESPRAVQLARRLAGWGLLLLLGLSIAPLGDALLRPLEQAYTANPTPEAVAGIVVLGGGESTRRTLAWGQPQVNEAGDRFLLSLMLARRYPDVPVLFTGGIGSLSQDGPSGAAVAESLLLAAGLEPSRLLLETTSRNTAENASHSLAIRPASGDGAWLLVTSAFHMPRAVETFCAAGWVELVPWPTDYRTGRLADGFSFHLTDKLVSLEIAMKEYLGLLAYRWTGRADRSAVGSCLASTPP